MKSPNESRNLAEIQKKINYRKKHINKIYERLWKVRGSLDKEDFLYMEYRIDALSNILSDVQKLLLAMDKEDLTRLDSKNPL